MGRFGLETDGDTIVSEFPSQVKDKVFLITGPSIKSIGAETALSLARGKPAILLLLGRSLEKIQPIIDEIEKLSPSTITKFIPIELMSLASVRKAASAILADKQIEKIDVLINNAGVMTCPYERTVDGYEKQFATNHLSHFLLTNLLAPLFLKADKPRIINVSSSGHIHGPVRFEDLGFEDGKVYDEKLAYASSKSANILFTVGLNQRFAAQKIDAVSWALHPGSIATGLQRHITDEIRNMWIEQWKKSGRAAPVRISAQQGCATTLRAALDPELDAVRGDSCYLTACEILPEGSAELQSWALDGDTAKKLWTVSEEMVGEKFQW